MNIRFSARYGVVGTYEEVQQAYALLKSEAAQKNIPFRAATSGLAYETPNAPQPNDPDTPDFSGPLCTNEFFGPMNITGITEDLYEALELKKNDDGQLIWTKNNQPITTIRQSMELYTGDEAKQHEQDAPAYDAQRAQMVSVWRDYWAQRNQLDAQYGSIPMETYAEQKWTLRTLQHTLPQWSHDMAKKLKLWVYPQTKFPLSAKKILEAFGENKPANFTPTGEIEPLEDVSSLPSTLKYLVRMPQI